MNMTKCVLLIGVLMIQLSNSNAQNENALRFDNSDDYVSTTNASGLIAGSNQISMAFWVYPENNTITGLDYDGYCGFRDNTLADFYVIQLTSLGNIECRFRNSSGINYDIVYTGVNINQWNHLAFTYDGSFIRLYHDTELIDSTSASGSITSAFEPFRLGMLPWPGSDFYLKGKLDEVSLWNKSLSKSEIDCIFLEGIDSTDTNLKLYYRMNQGVAGGNNAGQTTLYDASGNANGFLNGFSLNGNNSNYVAGKLNYISIVDTICNGDSYNFNGQIITTSGSYTQSFTSVNGCDSNVMLNLSVISIDTSVTQNGVILVANQNGSTYQWVDCNNNYAAIPGAFLKTYSPSQPGSYAVVLNLSGCSDTSGCRTVLSTALNDSESRSELKLFPSIASGFITLSAARAIYNADLIITDLSGRIVYSNHLVELTLHQIDVSRLLAGSYLVTIKTNDSSNVLRFSKQ